MAEATARSPAAVPRRPAGSWRAQRQGSPTGRRRARRFLAGFGVVALLALFAYLLIAPLGRPKTALILARPAEGANAQLSAVVPFVDRDLAAIAESARSMLVGPPTELTADLPPSVLFGSRLRESDPESDVLIVFVRADAATENGRAVLLWGREPSEAERRRYPVRDLLANLAEHPAATKVLLLDAAGAGVDRRAGRIDDEFSQRLMEECRRGPAGVWVMVSHGPGEQSHFSPALARSVFGYWIGRGLGGAADLDRDRYVRLQELHQFVASGVSAWVRQTSGGRQAQTPVLLACGRERASDADPLILPARRRVRPESEDAALQAALAEAEEARAKASETAVPAGDSTATGSVSATDTTNRQGTPATDEKADSNKADAAVEPVGNTADAAATHSGEVPRAGGPGDGPATTAQLTAAQLLKAGWKLRDDLEQGETARLDPRRDSPHLWRAYVQRLLELEQASLTGDSEERTAADRALRRLVLPLGRWAAGGDVEPDVAEPVRSLMTAPTAEPSWERQTFGMEEARAIETGVSLSSDLSTLIAGYDRLLASGSREELEKWLSEIAPGQRRYLELTAAGQFAAMPELDWEVARKALETRRLAERVAATEEAALWLAPVVEDADALRFAAERLLLDGIGANRQSIASELLTVARDRYEAAADDVAAIRESKALRNRLLDRAPELVAWHRRTDGLPGPRSPQTFEIMALLGAIEELASSLDSPSLDSPSPTNVDRVRSAAARARTLLATVQAGLSPEYVRGTLIATPGPVDDYLRSRALLTTTLPAAQDRLDLRDAARRAEESLVSGVPWNDILRRPLRSPVAAENDELRELIDLEYRLASLAVGGASRERLQSVTAAYQAITAAPESVGDDSSAAIQRFESALREFWRRTLPAVAEPMQVGDDFANSEMRLAKLFAADRALRMLDYRDAMQIGPSPTAPLRAELLASLLRWQARRIDLERRDTPNDEREKKVVRASTYREAAKRIAGREGASIRPTPLTIEGTRSVSLESDETATVELTVTNKSDRPTDVWLVVDHDPALVSIEQASSDLLPSFRLRQQTEGPTAEIVEPGRFNRPDLDGGAPPAFRIAAHASRPVTFQLRRESGAGRPTLVIVRAIARPAVAAEVPADARMTPADALMTRTDIAVALPTVAPTELIVEGPLETVTVTAGVAVVSPFPNRTTSFRMFLANRTRIAAAVDVELFAVTANTADLREPRSTSELPTVVGIDANAAASLLARWTNGVPLFAAAELALPADGTPVPVPFPKPVPGSSGPPPAVERGLLFVVTDRATGHRSVHPVLFRPQHPRRYLEPTVRYDAIAERVEIRIKPRDPALMPPGGSRVRCEVVESLPVEATRRLDGIVTPNGPPVELFVETAGLRSDAITLRLTVDGYPRAFHYRVPLSSSREDVPQETGNVAMRIISPPRGVSYRSPIDSVPVAIEVDAPIGARWNSDATVEIGFDQDRDRELQEEKSILLQSDRQVAVTVQQLAPGGLVAIESVIADFHLDLPADHLERGRVNIIGRVVAGERGAWSAPIEVTFDDVPPPIRRVRLSQGQVVAGEPLRVVAEGSDGGLSGISRVLVGIDLDRTGEFSAEPKPVAAVNEGGRWVATLDTASLLPGAYFVLVRAVDTVGIAGPYSRERFEIVTPEQRAAAHAAAVNRVTGFVQYRGRPMSGFEVLLKPLPAEPPAAADKPTPPESASATPPVKIPPVQTDDRGAFEISQVPPGRYQISAGGLYANRRRVGSQEIVVPPFPTEVPPVEIAVDPR